MSTSLQCVLHSDVARLYRRISKRLAVETTSLYCSCFITHAHHCAKVRMPSLLTCAGMHADHIVSSGSPHNNVLHFSSNMALHLVPGVVCAVTTSKPQCYSRLPLDVRTRPQGHLECDAFRIWKFHLACGLRNVKTNTTYRLVYHQQHEPCYCSCRTTTHS